MTLPFKKLQSFVLPFAFGAALIRVAIDYLVKFSFEDPLVYRFSFFVSFILEVALIIYVLKGYKKFNNDLLSLKESLKIGVIIMMVIGICYSIGSYIHDTYINPEFQKMIYQSIEKTIDDPKTFEQNNSPIGILSSTIRFIILGFVISLVTGNFLKTKQE